MLQEAGLLVLRVFFPGGLLALPCPLLLPDLRLTLIVSLCRTSMTEEYRVPDGMVGLSECGPL